MGNVRRTKLESFFEGNEDRILYVGETVRFESFSSFRVNISSQNEGVRLRRLSDQNDVRQAARVFVDGEEVTERLWYVADSNLINAGWKMTLKFQPSILRERNH